MVNSQKGPNAMSSKAKDVAKLAGVSMATVSRVMNGVENVADKTRARVLNAISQLRYEANCHASQLGRKNGGREKAGDKNRASFAAAMDMHIPVQGVDRQDRRRKLQRLILLENRYSRMRREFDLLNEELEKFKSTI